ncbi:hypothetical protein ABZ815_11090 [Nonomuraea sp. NPDC047529]
MRTPQDRSVPVGPVAPAAATDASCTCTSGSRIHISDLIDYVNGQRC